jgi:hypothetical protein
MMLMRTSGRRERWLRFVRLLVACLAFVVARPASAAAASVDAIVLVDRVLVSGAERGEPGERDGRGGPRASVASVGHDGSKLIERREAETPRLAKVQSSRVFTRRKYLSNCAFLC